MSGRFTKRRAEAVVDGEGKRQCAACGDYIDPIDWCSGCKRGECPAHPRLRKRADAAYCGDGCRSWDYSTWKAL